MKKGDKKVILSLLLVLIAIILVSFISLKFTGYLIKEQKKQVQFYFYDEKTNCSLNGYVFEGDKLIGKTYNGYFNLTYNNYKENLQADKNISIFGVLGDCFEKPNLFFDKYWESFEIKDYYFSGESVFNFKTQINPNNPGKKELLGFVNPKNEKVSSELNSINLKKNTLEDLSKINDYLNEKIKYAKDWDFNKETNYWQTPEETINLQQGDCEDYSTLLLSLFLAYNNSLNCYNIVFTSHVTTFCHTNDYYIYYDQEKTELKKQINKENAEQTKSQLEKLKQDYFQYYGINGDNETIAHYAFNDNQYIEFNNEDDFINWQYNLENTKKEFSLFESLENEAVKVQEKYSTELGELATQSALPTQKPTLKGFFMEKSILLISAGIIAIILILILIKINKK